MEFDKEKYHLPDINKSTAAIIGLGYVGLPLAVEIAKKQKSHLSGEKLERKVIGFDINNKRIEELKNGYDRTNEISQCHNLSNVFDDLTNNFKKLIIADIFIITVPTPIDKYMKPDLTALKNASITVAKALKLKKEIELNSKKRTIPIVIYESTVYPGTTEEICIPLIEKESGLSCDSLKNFKSFYCGYSPERINPGDKKHTISDIVKVTSGSNEEASIWINNFYMSIISAGTYKAQSIKIAEAAKIIENTQRDINIALVNELAIIFKLLKIDTLDVLKAASSKWNFLPFKPGLVGGHCIGVDPYYLTFKSQSLGYTPEVVLAGRKINDGMAKWVVDQLILEMCRKDIAIKSSNILILGFSFKENCPDIRNTKVLDMVKKLAEYNIDIDIVDPWVDLAFVKENYNLNISENLIKGKKYTAVISSVSHKQFLSMSLNEWKNLLKENGILYDLKGIIPRELETLRI
tara:strand:+ start:3155 stop:4546 length:1392 start_codon:yes stop_codon:yes gene_type:complete